MELFNRAKIPKNHWGCTLAQIPESAKHYPKIKEYLDNIVENVKSGKGMYFSNQPGRGKSGTAAIVAKCAIAHRFSVLWIESEKTVKYAIEKEQFDEDQTIYQRAESCDLLIMDEFFVDSKPRPCERYLEILLRTRIDAGKSTILTSNVSPTALKTRYPLLYSVLTEVTEFIDFDAKVNFR